MKAPTQAMAETLKIFVAEEGIDGATQSPTLNVQRLPPPPPQEKGDFLYAS